MRRLVVGTSVTVWIHAGACWPGVVATVCGHCGLSLVLVAGVCVASDGCASLVRWAEISSVLISSQTASTDGTELSVFVVSRVSGLGSTLAIEPAVAAASSISVGWRWTVTLLLLVMLSEPDLDKRADKEDEGSNHSDGKGNLVEAA